MRSSTSASRRATGAPSAATATRTPTRAIRPRGRSREPDAGSSGILVDYFGSVGATLSGSAGARARTFLSQLEPVLPGISKRWDGRASLDAWITYPWTLGSYSYYRVGQYQAFGAAEAEIEGAVHFCGEHTTQDFQGYLNGAVATGERAAAEVLAAL